MEIRPSIYPIHSLHTFTSQIFQNDVGFWLGRGREWKFHNFKLPTKKLLFPILCFFFSSINLRVWLKCLIRNLCRIGGCTRVAPFRYNCALYWIFGGTWISDRLKYRLGLWYKKMEGGRTCSFVLLYFIYF